MAYIITTDGKLYVDTAFLNQVQHRMDPKYVMHHVGFGDFELRAPNCSPVSFDRVGGSEPFIPNQSGRCHLVRGPQEVIAEMLEKMSDHRQTK